MAVDEHHEEVAGPSYDWMPLNLQKATIAERLVDELSALSSSRIVRIGKWFLWPARFSQRGLARARRRL